MSNNIKNIKKAIGNTFDAITATVAVTTEVIADTTGLISSSVGATPDVAKSIMVSPFSAAKGYLMESNDLSDEEAESIAFHYLNQSVATTITETSKGSGKLIAQLLEEDEDPITTSEKKEVINH